MSTELSVDLGALYRKGDRISGAILWFAAAVSLALAPWYGTWAEWALVGLPAAALPCLLAWWLPGARVTRVMMGIGYMVFAALVIHQARGMVEMHFSIFCLLAFLLVYRDWLPVLVAAGVTAAHHALFNALQSAGAGVYLFPQTGWEMVLVHAAFVAFQASVLVFLAETGRRDALAGVELDAVARGMRAQDGIDLRRRLQAPSSAVTRGMQESLDAVCATLGAAQGRLEDLAALGEAMDQNSRAVSERASAQSEETGSLATSVTEMSMSIQEVASNAATTAGTTERFSQRLDAVQGSVSQASGLIQEVLERLEQGSERIRALEEESERIGAVLDVIRNITERTNLLALNASIEAARAGEHGRGFAVVAEEVRTLAQQTTDSASEIERMIASLRDQTGKSAASMREGVEETARGAGQMREADGHMAELLTDAGQLDDLTSGIASAAEEQSQVAADIDRRLASISDRAAEAGRYSGDNASNAARVRAEVDGLRERMAQFRV